MNKEKPINALECLIVTCITHVCVGYAMGAISPAMEPITEHFALSDNWRGILGAAALAGNMLGSPIGGFIADLYGRRICIIAAWTVLIAGSAFSAASMNIWSLCIARLIVGWAVGAHYSGVIAYLSECLNPPGAAKLLSITELHFYIGNFFAIAAGALFKTYIQSTYLQWRPTLLLGGIPPVATLLYFVMYLPESTAWLHADRQTYIDAPPQTGPTLPTTSDEADSLNTLTTKKAVLFVSAFWASLVVPTYAVATFAVQIIHELGLSVNAFTLNTFLAAAIAIGVVCGIYFIDYTGRKILLLISQWGTAGAFLTLAIVQSYAASRNSLILNIIMILAFTIFELLNGCGAPLTLVYSADIFHPSVKGFASGVSAMNSRIISIVFVILMSIMLGSIGVGYALLSLSALSALGAIITHIMAPSSRTSGTPV